MTTDALLAQLIVAAEQVESSSWAWYLSWGEANTNEEETLHSDIFALGMAVAAYKESTSKACAYCGTLFQPEHGLQKYCPTDLEGKESRCSLKARQVRFRAKAREEHGLI